MQYQTSLKLTQGAKQHLPFYIPLLKHRIRKMQNTQMNKKKRISSRQPVEHVFQKPFIPASTHCISNICLLCLAFLSLQMCLSMSTRENRASICKWTSPAYSTHTSRHGTNNSIWSQHASVGSLPWLALWKRSLGEEKAAKPQEIYHCHIQHNIASWELPSAIILNNFFLLSVPHKE